MKRILAAFLALLMVLGSVMMFASCGEKPKLNLEKAEKNLDDEDYIVRLTDDEDDLEVGMSEMLYASNGSDYICIIKFKKSSTAKLAYQEIEYKYDCSVKECEMEIKSLEHILKTYEDDLKSSEIDNYEDQLKEMEEKLEDLKEQDDYIFGRSGKYIWYGTPDALKDSK